MLSLETMKPIGTNAAMGVGATDCGKKHDKSVDFQQDTIHIKSLVNSQP